MIEPLNKPKRQFFLLTQERGLIIFFKASLPWEREWCMQLFFNFKTQEREACKKAGGVGFEVSSDLRQEGVFIFRPFSLKTSKPNILPLATNLFLILPFNIAQKFFFVKTTQKKFSQTSKISSPTTKTPHPTNHLTNQSTNKLTYQPNVSPSGV